MAGISTHQKVSGFGSKPSIKKSGYASGGPDKSMLPNKIGKAEKTGYSGPNTQIPSFGK
jgi:hypothetical protein